MSAYREKLLSWLPPAFWLVVVLCPPLNHDAAAVLEFARRWWDGEALYRDLLDVNPPLVFVLNLVPAGLAKLVGGAPALLACLLGWLALAAWLARRVLSATPLEAGGLAVAVPLLGLSAGYDFGQREWLMAVAAMPYLLLAARRAEGQAAPLAVPVAVFAALGFALKPHFLAVPLAVEGWLLWQRRGAALRDPVPWAMVAVWLAYAASLPLLFPAFLREMLPLVRGVYLEAGDLAWWQVLLTERLGSALAALVPLAWLAFSPTGRRQCGALARVVALAGLGAVVSAVAQHKGWTYQALPARMFTALLAVVLAAGWLARAVPKLAPARFALGVSLALGVLGLTGAEAPWREAVWGWSREGDLARLLRTLPGERRVLVLSPDIFPVYPALAAAGARNTLPAMNTWLLRGCGGPVAAAQFRTIAQGFVARPPAAVLLAEHGATPGCGMPLARLAEEPLFAAALRGYRAVPAVQGYQLLVREE